MKRFLYKNMGNQKNIKKKKQTQVFGCFENICLKTYIFDVSNFKLFQQKNIFNKFRNI